MLRIHLFGIEHAAELENVSLKALVQSAGIPRPYDVEIRKAMRIADYVVLKDRAQGIRG